MSLFHTCFSPNISLKVKSQDKFYNSYLKKFRNFYYQWFNYFENGVLKHKQFGSFTSSFRNQSIPQRLLTGNLSSPCLLLTWFLLFIPIFTNYLLDKLPGMLKNFWACTLHTKKIPAWKNEITQNLTVTSYQTSVLSQVIFPDFDLIKDLR